VGSHGHGLSAHLSALSLGLSHLDHKAGVFVLKTSSESSSLSGGE
jgi:hypothetical protein